MESRKGWKVEGIGGNWGREWRFYGEVEVTDEERRALREKVVSVIYFACGGIIMRRFFPRASGSALPRSRRQMMAPTQKEDGEGDGGDSGEC